MPGSQDRMRDALTPKFFNQRKMFKGLEASS